MSSVVQGCFIYQADEDGQTGKIQYVYILLFIKCQRTRWLCHVERMEDTAIPKKEAVWKAMCDKTKRKTKTEMAG